MKIEIFKNISPLLLSKLKDFSPVKTQDIEWGEVYEHIYFLKHNYPENHFSEVPYYYSDLTEKTTGFIFQERMSEDLYYVHK
jgi:hypothetical protein